jgi:hypothetical protein
MSDNIPKSFDEVAFKSLWAENARLKEELIRIGHFDAMYWQEQWVFVVNDNTQKEIEINQLKKKVEMLTQGGDELIDIICETYCPEKGLAFDIWKAAKEGKLS